MGTLLPLSVSLGQEVLTKEDTGTSVLHHLLPESCEYSASGGLCEKVRTSCRDLCELSTNELYKKDFTNFSLFLSLLKEMGHNIFPHMEEEYRIEAKKELLEEGRQILTRPATLRERHQQIGAFYQKVYAELGTTQRLGPHCSIGRQSPLLIRLLSFFPRYLFQPSFGELADALSNPAYFELLLRKGADINARDHERGTLLHRYAYLRDENAIAYLARCGADVNAVNDEDFSALHIAALTGHCPSARVLLEFGADKNVRSRQNLIPAEIALTAEMRELLQS